MNNPNRTVNDSQSGTNKPNAAWTTPPQRSDYEQSRYYRPAPGYPPGPEYVSSSKKHEKQPSSSRDHRIRTEATNSQPYPHPHPPQTRHVYPDPIRDRPTQTPLTSSKYESSVYRPIIPPEDTAQSQALKYELWIPPSQHSPSSQQDRHNREREKRERQRERAKDEHRHERREAADAKERHKRKQEEGESDWDKDRERRERERHRERDHEKVRDQDRQRPREEYVEKRREKSEKDNIERLEREQRKHMEMVQQRAEEKEAVREREQRKQMEMAQQRAEEKEAAREREQRKQIEMAQQRAEEKEAAREREREKRRQEKEGERERERHRQRKDEKRSDERIPKTDVERDKEKERKRERRERELRREIESGRESERDPDRRRRRDLEQGKERSKKHVEVPVASYDGTQREVEPEEFRRTQDVARRHKAGVIDGGPISRDQEAEKGRYTTKELSNARRKDHEKVQNLGDESEPDHVRHSDKENVRREHKTYEKTKRSGASRSNVERGTDSEREHPSHRDVTVSNTYLREAVLPGAVGPESVVAPFSKSSAAHHPREDKGPLATQARVSFAHPSTRTSPAIPIAPISEPLKQTPPNDGYATHSYPIPIPIPRPIDASSTTAKYSPVSVISANGESPRLDSISPDVIRTKQASSSSHRTLKRQSRIAALGPEQITILPTKHSQVQDMLPPPVDVAPLPLSHAPRPRKDSGRLHSAEIPEHLLLQTNQALPAKGDFRSAAPMAPLPISGRASTRDSTIIPQLHVLHDKRGPEVLQTLQKDLQVGVPTPEAFSSAGMLGIPAGNSFSPFVSRANQDPRIATKGPDVSILMPAQPLLALSVEKVASNSNTKPSTSLRGTNHPPTVNDIPLRRPYSALGESSPQERGERGKEKLAPVSSAGFSSSPGAPQAYLVDRSISSDAQHSNGISELQPTTPSRRLATGMFESKQEGLQSRMHPLAPIPENATVTASHRPASRLQIDPPSQPAVTDKHAPPEPILATRVAFRSISEPIGAPSHPQTDPPSQQPVVATDKRAPPESTPSARVTFRSVSESSGAHYLPVVKMKPIKSGRDESKRVVTDPYHTSYSVNPETALRSLAGQHKHDDLVVYPIDPGREEAHAKYSPSASSRREVFMQPSINKGSTVNDTSNTSRPGHARAHSSNHGRTESSPGKRAEGHLPVISYSPSSRPTEEKQGHVAQASLERHVNELDTDTANDRGERTASSRREVSVQHSMNKGPSANDASNNSRPGHVRAHSSNHSRTEPSPGKTAEGPLPAISSSRLTEEKHGHVAQISLERHINELDTGTSGDLDTARDRGDKIAPTRREVSAQPSMNKGPSANDTSTTSRPGHVRAHSSNHSRTEPSPGKTTEGPLPVISSSRPTEEKHSHVVQASLERHINELDTGTSGDLDTARDRSDRTASSWREVSVQLSMNKGPSANDTSTTSRPGHVRGYSSNYGRTESSPSKIIEGPLPAISYSPSSRPTEEKQGHVAQAPLERHVSELDTGMSRDLDTARDGSDRTALSRREVSAQPSMNKGPTVNDTSNTSQPGHTRGYSSNHGRTESSSGKTAEGPLPAILYSPSSKPTEEKQGHVAQASLERHVNELDTTRDLDSTRDRVDRPQFTEREPMAVSNPGVALSNTTPVVVPQMVAHDGQPVVAHGPVAGIGHDSKNSDYHQSIQRPQPQVLDAPPREQVVVRKQRKGGNKKSRSQNKDQVQLIHKEEHDHHRPPLDNKNTSHHESLAHPGKKTGTSPVATMSQNSFLQPDPQPAFSEVDNRHETPRDVLQSSPGQHPASSIVKTPTQDVNKPESNQEYSPKVSVSRPHESPSRYPHLVYRSSSSYPTANNASQQLTMDYSKNQPSSYIPSNYPQSHSPLFHQVPFLPSRDARETTPVVTHHEQPLPDSTECGNKTSSKYQRGQPKEQVSVSPRSARQDSSRMAPSKPINPPANSQLPEPTHYQTTSPHVVQPDLNRRIVETNPVPLPASSLLFSKGIDQPSPYTPPEHRGTGDSRSMSDNHLPRSAEYSYGPSPNEQDFEKHEPRLITPKSQKLPEFSELQQRSIPYDGARGNAPELYQETHKKSASLDTSRTKPSSDQTHPPEIWHPPVTSREQEPDRAYRRHVVSVAGSSIPAVIRAQPSTSIAMVLPLDEEAEQANLAQNAAPVPEMKVYRYLREKRNRTMSVLSTEAQDGTATSILGSPTASVLSQPPIRVPSHRDPMKAAHEWLSENIEATKRGKPTGKRRVMRPGVVFDVGEDPPPTERRRRVKPSRSKTQPTNT